MDVDVLLDQVRKELKGAGNKKKEAIAFEKVEVGGSQNLNITVADGVNEELLRRRIHSKAQRKNPSRDLLHLNLGTTFVVVLNLFQPCTTRKVLQSHRRRGGYSA